jgi:DNA-binding MarR family transcriptional regulator
MLEANLRMRPINAGAIVTVTFTDDEKKVLKGLAEVLEGFQMLRANIPLHQVTMLLRLAIDEGHSQKHYSESLGLPPSTVSRAFLDMGKRMRGGDEGLGLVEEKTSAHSLREHEMFVSTKGRTMLRNAVKKLCK